MTNPNLLEAARKALDALENHVIQRTFAGGGPICEACIALREAIADAESAKRQRKDPEPEIAFLLRVADARQQIIDGMIAERCAKQDAEMPRPLADWHEDDGAVVWWRFLVDEPAWIGTPLDDDWPGYHTHWTPHPKLPERER